MLALYRKYRPRKFQEVIGQDHITTTLQNSIKMGKIQHAYLFCGPKGTGKTSLARIISKAVNCLDSESVKKFGEPCLKCENCKKIFSNKTIDIIEIDAASNRGIDEIRQLRESSKFTPTELKYKVFIIDEVHMLTKEAFNALLKTLEEPPAHIIFILATTESHKVLETIKSRCQQFDLKRISQTELIKHTKKIAQKENINIEDNALHLIAANSDGSSRDALSLLSSLTVFNNTKFTLEKTKEILGFSDQIFIVKFIDFIINKDASSAIKLINELFSNGTNLNQFSDELLDYLRKLMLLKIDPELSTISDFNFTKEQLAKIKKQAFIFEKNILLKFIDSIISRRKEINQTPYPQLPLELAIVENLQTNNLKIKKQKNIINTKPESKTKILEEKNVNINSPLPQKQQINVIEIKKKWPNIITEIKKINFSLGGILNSLEIINIKNSSLILACKYAFHKEIIENIKNKNLLEDIILKLLNSKIKIKLSLISELPNEIQQDIKKEKEINDNKKAENLYNAAVSAFESK